VSLKLSHLLSTDRSGYIRKVNICKTMAKKADRKSEYAPGKNPNSLDNLIHSGRPSGEEIYGETKKKRTLTVTESGWQGVVRAARAAGCTSVSEYMEKIGRGHVGLSA